MINFLMFLMIMLILVTVADWIIKSHFHKEQKELESLRAAKWDIVIAALNSAAKYNATEVNSIKRYISAFLKTLDEREDINMDKETIDIMRDLVKIQGEKGNYDQNEYMLGMYNGMELMLATAEDREPIYKRSNEQDVNN